MVIDIRGWVEVVAWWAVLMLLWLGTVPTMSLQEVIAATVLALPCAVVAPRWCSPTGGRPRTACWALNWFVLGALALGGLPPFGTGIIHCG